MRNKKVLLVCLYFFILFTEVLGIPGSGSFGGRSGFSGKTSTTVKGSLGSRKSSGKAPVGTNVGGGGDGTIKVAKTGGSILSAWGIIALILFIIVGSALAYYISIFYPLICAKRGKYDVMEMTAV